MYHSNWLIFHQKFQNMVPFSTKLYLNVSLYFSTVTKFSEGWWQFVRFNTKEMNKRGKSQLYPVVHTYEPDLWPSDLAIRLDILKEGWTFVRFKGVLHPWALFLKTLCIFSKNKATSDKVPYGSGQKCSKELKNHSFTSVETTFVKLQWKMCKNQYFRCFEP